MQTMHNLAKEASIWGINLILFALFIRIWCTNLAYFTYSVILSLTLIYITKYAIISKSMKIRHDVKICVIKYDKT